MRNVKALIFAGSDHREDREGSEIDVRRLCRSEENTAIRYSASSGKGHRTG